MTVYFLDPLPLAIERFGWAGSYSFYSRYFGAIVAVPKGFTVRAHRFSEPWRRVQKEGRRCS